MVKIGKCKNCGRETHGSLKTKLCRKCFLTIGNPSKRPEVREVLRRQKLGSKNPRFGKPPWNKGLKGFRAGEQSNFWKGGKTPFLKRLRTSIEYDEWRRKVFERDGYKCQNCGSRKDIQADHIKPIALFPNLIFDIDNGRTLCKKCHNKTITFGKGALTLEKKFSKKVVSDYDEIKFNEKKKKKCLFCGKEFLVPQYRQDTAKFCSKKCFDKSKKGKQPEHLKKFTKKGVCLNTGRTHFKKGHIPWIKGLKGIHLSPKTEFKKGMIPWNKKNKKYGSIIGSRFRQWKRWGFNHIN